MLELLKQLITSKKFMAGSAAVVTIFVMKVAGKLGFVLDPSTANEIANLVCVIASTYIMAQGIADHGKEAAKVTAEPVVEKDPGPKPLMEG